MKIVAIILAALVVFAGALAGLLAATGNLNAEALGRLAGAPAAGAAALPEKVPSTDELAAENRTRMGALEERERKLDEREKQLTQREKDLESLRAQLETMKTQIDGAMKSADQERTTQMETVANTIVEMKPEAAAQRLEKFSVEDQAEIVKRITKVKDRAKILEAMKPETAARVMTFLQSPTPL
jgi:flagellar motility protein MotE (MotC chaperone)